MTPNHARTILLEDALEDAQHTVRFLHNCLTHPETYSYAHPDMTVGKLAWWETLVKPHASCPHSRHDPMCTACVETSYARYLHAQALSTLGMA